MFIKLFIKPSNGSSLPKADLRRPSLPYRAHDSWKGEGILIEAGTKVTPALSHLMLMFFHRAKRVAKRPATACGPHSALLLKHTFPPVLLHYLADLLISPLVLVRLFYSQAGISISTPRMAVTCFCPSHFYCGRKSRDFFFPYSISLLKEKTTNTKNVALGVSCGPHLGNLD